MSDYLAKPLTPAALLAAIDKWSGAEQSLRETLPQTDRSMAELRDEFLAQCAKDLAVVKSLLASRSPSTRDGLKKLVHRVAGTAGMLGLTEVSAFAKELDEVLGRDGTPVHADYAQFVARLEQLVRAA